MDHFPKFVLNSGGSEGSEEPKWTKFPNTMGGQSQRAKTDQIGVRRPELRGPEEKSGK